MLEDARIQGFKNTRIQGYKDFKILYKIHKIQRYNIIKNASLVTFEALFIYNF
jgi:hypothetical protein